MKQFLDETYCFRVNQKLLLKKRLLCSLSGGQDSSVVFFSLLHTKTTNQYLNIIYCHHFWQAQNFQAAVGIFKLSFALKIPYTLILPNMSLFNENRSRDWRKKTLFRVSTIEHPSILVTGQTETDRLETNFNNLFRGTSSKGFRKSSSQTFQTPIILFFSPFVFIILSNFRFRLNQSKQTQYLEKNGQKFKFFRKKPYSFSNNQNVDVLIKHFETVFNQTHQKSNTFQPSNLKLKKIIPNFPTSLSLSHKQFSWEKRCFPKIFQFLDFPTNFVCGKESGRGKKIFSKKLENLEMSESFLTQKKTLNQNQSTQLVFGKFWVWKNNKHKPNSKTFEISCKNNRNIEFSNTPQAFFGNGKNLYPKNFGSYPKMRNLEMNKRFRHQNKHSVSFCIYSYPIELKLNIDQPIEKKTRGTISKLAKIYDLSVFQDITNFSFHSSRNKIRHVLFPLFGSIFQKKVNFSLSHFFKILTQENQYFENLFQKLYFLFNFFPLFYKEDEFESFEKLLWAFFYDTSELSFQAEFVKKTVENFSERSLSFEQIFSLEKILLIERLDN